MIVVKVGGSEGIDLRSFCQDVASLVREGRRLILVHGGSQRAPRGATRSQAGSS